MFEISWAWQKREALRIVTFPSPKCRRKILGLPCGESAVEGKLLEIVRICQDDLPVLTGLQRCAIQLQPIHILLQYVSLFSFCSALFVGLWSTTQLTMVEVLQPANLSHPSLVFGTCADVYPSIKDVRQENVVDLMLGQHRQPICLLFPNFFCEAATFAQRNCWRNGWDNNPILPFWCMFKCFFWMELCGMGMAWPEGHETCI